MSSLSNTPAMVEGMRVDPDYDPDCDPYYDPDCNPDYVPDCDPDYDPDCEPYFDPDYDPDYVPDCDPEYDPDCDPEYDPDCNPDYGPECDPDHDPDCNPVYGHDLVWDQGLILQDSISAENFSDKFSTSNFMKNIHPKTTFTHKSTGIENNMNIFLDFSHSKSIMGHNCKFIFDQIMFLSVKWRQKRFQKNRLQFHETPVMSTYLLAFAISDFQHVETRSR
jgi:hypothetical protein